MKNYLIQNWIDILALIISFLGLFKDSVKDIYKSHKEKKEKKKAFITTRVINKQLNISNIGLCEARNIVILVDGEDINHSIFSAFSKNMDFSILKSNNTFSIRYIHSLDEKKNYKIRVEWEDDYSSNNFMEDIINL